MITHYVFLPIVSACIHHVQHTFMLYSVSAMAPHIAIHALLERKWPPSCTFWLDILHLREWNPLPLMGQPVAPDKYTNCSWHIIDLLIRTGSPAAIFQSSYGCLWLLFALSHSHTYRSVGASLDEKRLQKITKKVMFLTFFRILECILPSFGFFPLRRRGFALWYSL